MFVKVPKPHFWVLLWALWAQNLILMGPQNLKLKFIMSGPPLCPIFLFFLYRRNFLYNPIEEPKSS